MKGHTKSESVSRTESPLFRKKRATKRDSPIVSEEEDRSLDMEPDIAPVPTLGVAQEERHGYNDGVHRLAGDTHDVQF